MWSADTSPAARAAPPPPMPPPPARPRRRTPPPPLTAAVAVALALAVAVAAAAAAPGASAWPAPSSDASPTSAAPPPPPPREAPRRLLPDAKDRYDAGPPMPDFVKPCRRADPELNTCVRDSFNTFVRGAYTGVPSLGLPSFDPMEMPYVNLSESVPGNLTLTLLLRGVNVRGFSKNNVINVRANPEEQKLELTTRAPWLGVDGSFSASGAVLTFPLSAHGAFSVNMTEVSSSWIIYYSEQILTKGGPKHFVVDNFEFDISPEDVTYNFGETLDDDNQLGEAMNAFFNTNAHEVFGDVKGRVAEQLSRMLHSLVDTVLEAFPADRLLLPD